MVFSWWLLLSHPQAGMADSPLRPHPSSSILLPILLSLLIQADWPTLSLSSGGIFSISTFALSLLLVFRTNSSYEVRPANNTRGPWAWHVTFG